MMHKFILTSPKTVYFKRNKVEHSEAIAAIDVGSLSGEPDDIELEARRSLVRSGTYADGSIIALEALNGLDVSGGLRDAYHQALTRARAKLPDIGEGMAAL